jgi:hypothetical protein
VPLYGAPAYLAHIWHEVSKNVFVASSVLSRLQSVSRALH